MHLRAGDFQTGDRGRGNRAQSDRAGAPRADPPRARRPSRRATCLGCSPARHEARPAAARLPRVPPVTFAIVDRRERKVLERWNRDPLAFLREALGGPEPWSRQLDVLEAVRAHRTTNVVTGHAVG